MLKKLLVLFLGCLSLVGCCLTCPAQKPVFLHPCDRIIYEAQQQGVIVIRRGDILRIILPADTFFYPASSKIKEESKPALGTVSALVSCYCYSCMPLRVTGYTDNMGSIRQQKQLGLQRAKNIAAYLWGEGVPLDRITAQTMGARGTLSSNGTPSGEADNRRVEITLP